MFKRQALKAKARARTYTVASGTNEVLLKLMFPQPTWRQRKEGIIRSLAAQPDEMLSRLVNEGFLSPPPPGWVVTGEPSGEREAARRRRQLGRRTCPAR